MIKQKTEKNTTEHSEHNHFRWECDIRLYFEGFFYIVVQEFPLTESRVPQSTPQKRN